MNLIEAERLIRRLTEVLQHQPRAPQARQLAQDYAEVCREVNARLEQCSSMLAAGEEQQALQLAEAAPPLLDLITRLSFRQVADWRAFCQAHELPIAETLEAKFIRQLGEAYGKGLTADHQLYREYRQAILSHRDEQAVAVLRVIARRNPADANAPRELERLEHKILNDRMANLDQALARNDTPQVLQWVRQIEGLNFHVAPEGKTWRDAQMVRFRFALSEARRLRELSAWAEVEPWLTQIQTLCAEYSLLISPEEARERDEAEAWLASCQLAHEEERKFLRCLADVRQLVSGLEEKQVMGHGFSRTELRAEHQQLERKWRELGQFSRPIDDALALPTQKMLRLLESLYERKTRRLRLGVIGAIVLWLALSLGLSLELYSRHQASGLITELNRLGEQREVNALEKLVQHIERNELALARRPSMQVALAKAHERLDAEAKLHLACQAELKDLNELAARNFSGLAPAELLRQLHAAQDHLRALAKPFQTAEQPQWQILENRWEAWLGQQRQQRESQFQALIENAGRLAREGLRYEYAPARVRQSLQDLETSLARLTSFITPPISELQLGPSCVQEFGALTSRVASFQLELARWDRIQSAQRQPASWEAYWDSLRLMQTNEFVSSEDKGAATQLISLNLTATSFVNLLLITNQPEALAAFERQPLHPLKPPEVLSLETDMINRLRNDENIHNVKLFQLAQLSLPATNAARARVIFARSQPTRAGVMSKFDAAYDPQSSPQAVNFRVQEYPRVKFECAERGVIPEKELFDRLGISQLIDSRGGSNYTMSILVVLDQLNEEREGSALFRAYLAARLFRLMDLRPAEWGLHWAPTAAADRVHLRELGADDLVSGDWLVPAKIQAMNKKFEDHFVQARRVSYVKQAVFLNQLAAQAKEKGFQMVGHVSREGKAVLATGSSSEPFELWGIESRSRLPALLFHRNEASQSWETEKRALPFSPLLAPKLDRRVLLDQVAQSQGVAWTTPELRRLLPPLFGGL
jgi:hypothetical protein